MRQIACGLAALTGVLILAGSAQAQPLAATYKGVLFGTNDAFTAVFHYDTKDLSPSLFASGYLDGKPGTLQSATYSDPFRSMTFTTPGSFSKGEYDSTVYDENGAVTEVDTVHAYSISTSSGLVSLTFGGANDMGIVTFDSDGLDYAELDPQSFTLTKDVVSPVPLPSGAPMLASALVLFGLLGHARSRWSAGTAG